MTVVETSEPTAEQIVEHWLVRYSNALTKGSASDVADLFVEGGFWKDILAFTGTFRTFSGRASIAEAFAATFPHARPKNVRVAPGREAPRFVRRSAKDIIETFIDFDTEIGRGTAFVRLLRNPAAPLDPQIWIMLTSLQDLRGYEERIGEHRPTGVNYSENFAGDNWLDERIAETRFDDRDPEAIVIGGGQSGLILAARLRQMGVDALVVERNERIGDNWRQRYHSLTLHNQVWANSLPYMPFPETWPTFVPKDKLAGWLEAYAEAMELNVWTGTEVTDATHDEVSGLWTVRVRRGDGTERTLQSRNVIIATGGSSGVPNKPELPGLDAFRGEVIHSSAFTSGIPYAGRKAIVIGTGNSGHDVAQDLYSNGADVTMMQRNPTTVVSLVPSGTLVYGVYSEGLANDDVDLITASIPYEVLRETYQWLTKRTCGLDQELIDKLNAVGFQTEYGADGTGFHMKYLRTGGGYYINVGCSDLIADRKIGLVQASDVDTFTTDGLRMSDGTLVEADLVVLATGYRNLQHGIATMFGEDVAEKVGPVWGFDENHIMRNMWQRTAQPGLWVMGGSLIDARLYSRFLALQIVADIRRVDLPPPPEIVSTRSLSR